VLAYLELKGVRNLAPAKLDFHRSLNIVHGENASGKTSLLEAIALVTSGRSFRSHHLENILNHNADHFLLFAKTDSGDRLGYQWSGKNREIHLNGEPGATLSRLAQVLPMHWFTPETHAEFARSRRHRIATLDWVLFHVEQNFYEVWSRYRRLLAQRNAALKAGASTNAWDADLVKQAEAIANFRSQAQEQLAPHIKFYSEIIPGAKEITFRVRQGWSEEKGLQQALLDDRERDRKDGYTHSGAHRADFEIFIDGQRLREQASQGQLKLLVLALRLSQLRLFRDSVGRECLLLLDDLPAELDPERRKRVMTLFAEMPLQVFITATEPELIDLSSWGHGYKMFHVKHGQIAPL